MKKIVIILITFIVFLLCACDGKDDLWPSTGIGTLLPEPESGKVRILAQSNDHYSVLIDDIEFDSCENYINQCQNLGYSIDCERGPYSSFDAFNDKGYHIRITVNQAARSMSIDLEAPIEMTSIKWPNNEVAKVIPQPASLIGKMQWETEDGFLLYVGDTTKEQYAVYVDKCMETGFTKSYSREDKYFHAENAEGVYLILRYEGFNIISIQIQSPDAEEANSEEIETETISEISTEEETSIQEETETTTIQTVTAITQIEGFNTLQSLFLSIEADWTMDYVKSISEASGLYAFIDEGEEADNGVIYTKCIQVAETTYIKDTGSSEKYSFEGDYIWLVYHHDRDGCYYLRSGDYVIKSNGIRVGLDGMLSRGITGTVPRPDPPAQTMEELLRYALDKPRYNGGNW